jgi:pantothenate kinase
MDGYHYSHELLVEKYGKEGLRRKGAPFTFDTTTLVHDLRQAKDSTESMFFPEYSREASRPVPNAIRFDPSAHRIILVEGLYLLHARDLAWAPLQELWDERWWVEVPSRQEQIERVVQRAFRTWNPLKRELWGDGMEGARKRTWYNDVSNMETIAYCRECADVIIETGENACRVYHRT